MKEAGSAIYAQSSSQAGTGGASSGTYQAGTAGGPESASGAQPQGKVVDAEFRESR